LSDLESVGSVACVKLRLCVVKSPDISLSRGVACARFAGGPSHLRRCRDPVIANVEQLLGEGPIKQDETTHVGVGA
jgi:hypothetical protein